MVSLKVPILGGSALALLLISFGTSAGAEKKTAENQKTFVDPRVRPFVHEARLAMHAKHYDAAIKAITAGLAYRMDPRHEAILHCTRAEAYLYQGNVAQAEPDTIAAVQLDPGSTEAQFNRGLVYRKKGENEKAIAAYTRAIHIKPDWALAYSNRGNAYAGTNQYETAIRDFNEALRCRPDYADALVNRGDVYAELLEYSKALADFAEAIRTNPGMENARVNRAIVYEKLGDYGNALADLNEAARQTPRDPNIYAARASVYRHQEMIDLALRDYQAAAALPATDPAGHLARARAFIRIGQYASAAEEYRLMEAKIPGSWQVAASAAWFEATCPDASFRNGKEAIEKAKAICERTRWKDGDQIDTLAAAYAELGDFDQAIKYQTEAMRVHTPPVDPAMEEHLHSYQEQRPWREEPLR